MNDQPPNTFYPGYSQWQNQQPNSYQPGGGPPSQQPGYAQPFGDYSQQPYPPMQNPQGMYPPPAQYPVYGVANPVPQAEPGSGMAVASLVLGIISVITFFLWPVGLPVSIIGIVLGALGRRSVSRRTMATTGLVLSIVGLVLLFGVCALYGIILSTSHTNSTP